ncbi:gamma-glutamyltransferase [Variovorax fucosicus]|uniref:gamma-glutamyltransferase n=1 Tax=Variovorax fucosicus TaxID=3053517 RepID=UPI002578A95C|nr:gamma-glutamyltransferase [Variovorax sp. J22G47]MDM0054596.1 gamma-glutamyltransferase [Variovorax sp. J22G47]
MRDFEAPGRSVAVGSRGMVATSNPQAALAGLDVLRSGGNAIDAAVAAAAMLAVVEPTQTGIGGDCFVMLRKRGQAPVALNGSGWAAKAASAEELRGRGMASIPVDSVHALTVPGAVRAWNRLVEDYGTRSLQELLEPAIGAAELGYLVTERLAHDWARQAAKMMATAEAKALFFPAGRAPALGERRSNPQLGKTLRAIAKSGADSFYEGWVAENIVTSLRKKGSLLSLDDFAEFKPEYVTPISASYRGYRLWECPPNGQGVVALQIAAMLEAFDLSAMGPLSAERFHLQAELSRIAYAQRNAFLCDPRFNAVDVNELLSDDTIERLTRGIDLDAKSDGWTPVALPEHKDTVYVSVADSDGTLVSFINSIYDDFGSGIVAPGTGVLMHNRGSGFVLEEGHPNELQGRKRPMHTIIPALVTKDADTVMSFGVTGGHFQPAGQLQVLSNIVDYGMSVQQAIDHARMFARGDVLELERTVPDAVWSGLRKRGHEPVAAPSPLGTCHAIWVDQGSGVYMGGSDGRRDGLAIGF